MDTTCPFCGALSSFAIADVVTWACGSESCSFSGPGAWQSPECKLRLAKAENETLAAALCKIARLDGCECDAYEGHVCKMCKVRTIAMDALPEGALVAHNRGLAGGGR